MRIAWELGKSLDEVDEMPLEEYQLWGAFFLIQNEDQERAQRLAKTGQRGK
jgi:hypothetical protein